MSHLWSVKFEQVETSTKAFQETRIPFGVLNPRCYQT